MIKFSQVSEHILQYATYICAASFFMLWGYEIGKDKVNSSNYSFHKSLYDNSYPIKRSYEYGKNESYISYTKPNDSVRMFNESKGSEVEESRSNTCNYDETETNTDFMQEPVGPTCNDTSYVKPNYLQLMIDSGWDKGVKFKPSYLFLRD